MTVKLTSVGMVSKLKKKFGVQATTCSGPNPGNPNDVTAAIAVQGGGRNVNGDWRKWLREDQNMVRVEHLGRGLSAWERDE